MVYLKVRAEKNSDQDAVQDWTLKPSIKKSNDLPLREG